MERYSDEAIRIIDELHTERLDYQSEYIPLIDAAQRLDAYESTGMEPENIGALQEELNQYKKLGDLDRLREIVQADREGRCVVLPLVERECVDKFLDDLKDVFSEWGYEDASVGLFGMNESEKQLAEAIIAALEKEVNRNG